MRHSKCNRINHKEEVCLEIILQEVGECSILGIIIRKEVD